MGQHKHERLRACPYCGAQEVATAEAHARHFCAPDSARMVRRRRGLCVECGKPSLPYVKCDHHRFADRVRYALNRGSRYGMFVKSFKPGDRRAYYRIGDLNAQVGRRGWYKTRLDGRAPRGFFPFVMAYLQQQGQPMSEDSIYDAFVSYRRDRAAKGHLEVSVQ